MKSSSQAKTKGTKNNKKGKSNVVKIPKTVQESIPYRNVYKNGIIEVSEGVFSKSYPLEDVNFKIATQEDQENIFIAYGDLLNSFDANTHIEVTINNKSIDADEFAEKILIKPQKDDLAEYREEYNQMLLDKLHEGRNNLTREKYITVSIQADNIEAASNQFIQIDAKISECLSRINHSQNMAGVQPLTLEERLNILYDIYNLNSPINFKKRIKTNTKEDYKFFDMGRMASMGMTSKDLIGPDSMSFKKDYFMIGNSYGRSLFVDNLPAFMNCNIMSDISDAPCNMIASIHMDSISQDKAVKMIKTQMLNINSNVVDAQKKATKNGYDASMISPDLQKAQEEAKKLLDDITSRNQKLYFLTVVITHFADSLEELDKDTATIQSTVSKHLCQCRRLDFLQELGFASSLPLANNKINVKRLLTTESASVFIPYSSKELIQENGMYYGLNAVSKNMILFNRLNSQNYNGVILGMPGSGKSFAAKREMVNVLLNTNDDVYVIDPNGEYGPLADMFGGEKIRIAPGSEIYINPFDMDINYADQDDPITLKCDFISSLCEIAIGGNIGLTPAQKSIIDRCVREVYGPYIQHMQALEDKSITCDVDASPTMQEFFELLLSQPQIDAQNIAISLERFVTGSLNTFAHRTNVKLNNRFVIYDIKDIGKQMKEMGLQVCINDIWNRIIKNHSMGKRTWFYIDEFHLLAQNESSARYIQEIYKMARKWHGIPTGITQNVEDLLKSPETRGVINNCSFVLMLNQSPIDRSDLASMFNISSSQLQYISYADPGQGLLFNGKTIIPFKDSFPKDTKLYKAMSTNPNETQDIRAF